MSPPESEVAPTQKTLLWREEQLKKIAEKGLTDGLPEVGPKCRNALVLAVVVGVVVVMLWLW